MVYQSYLICWLLRKLIDNRFLESSYYRSMPDDGESFHEELKAVGVDNQGCVLMMLYALLVIPKEAIKGNLDSPISQLNEYLRCVTQDVISTYPKDKPSINFLRHIRNAVAHARVAFHPGNKVVFDDECGSYKFSCALPLSRLGQFIKQLEIIHESQFGRDALESNQ